jgi:hypothetical protein
MLEPRMVAASIQVVASGLHGTPAVGDRITASSQGILMEARGAIQRTRDSEDRSTCNTRIKIEDRL